jgi:hypothetical protein
MPTNKCWHTKNTPFGLLCTAYAKATFGKTLQKVPMKSLLCLFLVSVATTYLFAQNKTLGVGTASPNPNAALHVESPTNNASTLARLIFVGGGWRVNQ